MRKVALALLALPPAAMATPRADLALHWAPIFYQETHDPVKDLYSAYDFDGDWDGDNNAENMACYAKGGCPSAKCDGQGCPLVATVYYAVFETATHWFIQYMPYHPLDWKLTSGHEHDTESVFAVVGKDGSPFGALQALETRFHIWWLDFADGQSVTNGAASLTGPIHYDQSSGRPAVYVQMVGHGICGGFSPPNYVDPELSLTCDGATPPHIDKDGVVYHPDLAPSMPQVTSGVVMAGYTLVDNMDVVWPHIHEIGAGKAFKSAVDYGGERCATFACPKQFGGPWEGDEGSSPAEPWAQPGGSGVSADGDQFFDPAYAMSKRLKFPMPFSLDYCWNPYLAITTGCPGDQAPDLLTAAADARVSDGGAMAPVAGGCGCRLGPSPLGKLRLFILVAIAVLLVARRRR